MAYNKEYYQKNREKLLDRQKEYQRKNYKSIAKSKKSRQAALKAWETRRMKGGKKNNGFRRNI